MATASDFRFITGDNVEEVSVRTATGGQGDENRRFSFMLDTPLPDVGGVLMFMVRGLTKAGYAEPRILMNDHITPIARVERAVDAGGDTWFTQIVRIDPGVLRSGENHVVFFLATPTTTTGDPDAYFLRDVICHYRKTL